MRYRLRHKIIALVTSVVFASLVVSLILLRFWIGRETDRRVDQELMTAARVVDEFAVNLAERLEIVCGSIAEAPRFRAVIELGDPETILDSAGAELGRVEASAMLVLDGAGKTMARIGPDDFGGPDPGRLPVMAAALAGDGGSDLWRTGDRLYQVAAEPVTRGEDITGCILIGQPIGDETARKLAHLTATEVTIRAGNRPVASTLGDEAAKRLLEALAAAPAATPPVPRAMDDRHKYLPIPMPDRSGSKVAEVVLLRSLEAEIAYLGQMQWSLTLGAGAVGMVGFVLALLFASAMTNPLQVLMKSTQAVNAGNYDDPVPVLVSDEIGLLAARFDEMRVSLKTKIQELIEQERIRSEMELEKHRSLSRMVAGVAHEINTPLGIVNQAASVIQEMLSTVDPTRLGGGPEVGEALSDVADAARLIQGNIAKANHLIQSFKNLSVRQVTDQRETVVIGELVAEVVDLFRIQAREAHLQITVADSLPPESRSWNGFPGFFSQILMNLLTNVARYAYPEGQGGPVTLELAEVPGREPAAFRMTVRDQGRGIPTADQSKVFEVFFTTGRERGGSGLGLSIVHTLVTSALHGTIELESEPGKGAAFHVVLPLHVPEPVEA